MIRDRGRKVQWGLSPPPFTVGPFALKPSQSQESAMSFNTFGHLFRVTTWGESHGPALGATVDG
ncbi:MAG TPA: hypothetical protein PLH11_10315, partial [Gemmobacter sp.]|nr:hypothetical protein [Gemmobacter sp.]